MNTADIGRRLAARRKLLGLDQASLAEIAGVSRHALVNIETGKANPTFKVLSAVAESLGLELRLDLKPVPGVQAHRDADHG